jgi:hypothetical protein
MIIYKVKAHSICGYVGVEVFFLEMIHVMLILTMAIYPTLYPVR